MQSDNQRSQVMLVQVLNLVDQKQPASASPRGSITNYIEQIRQIEL